MTSMSIEIEITNQTLYEELVSAVNIDRLTIEDGGVYTGLIEIYKKDKGWSPFYGLIGSEDFKEDFGFILKTRK